MTPDRIRKELQKIADEWAKLEAHIAPRLGSRRRRQA